MIEHCNNELGEVIVTRMSASSGVRTHMWCAGLPRRVPATSGARVPPHAGEAHTHTLRRSRNATSSAPSCSSGTPTGVNRHTHRGEHYDPRG